MTPDQLMQMFQGIQATGVLRAAVELDVFRVVSERGTASAAVVAQDIGAPSRSTRVLVEALAALGLLRAQPDGFTLSKAAEDHLVPGTPAYMGDLVRIFGNDLMFEVFRKLPQAVKNDGSVLDEHAETPRHAFWEDFAKWTAAMAAPAGGALAGILEPWAKERSVLRVLDVACGTGLYGYQLARAFPQARVTSQDYPNVLEHTEGYARAFGVSDRVEMLPGDMFELDWGNSYDVIVFSHVFHHFDDERSRALLKKAASALSAEGRVVIHDFVRGLASPAEDPAPYMFSTVMLGWTKRGEAYDKSRFERLLRETGHGALEVYPAAPMPTRFLITKKRA